MYYLLEDSIRWGTPWRRLMTSPGLSPEEFPHSLPNCIALQQSFAREWFALTCHTWEWRPMGVFIARGWVGATPAPRQRSVWASSCTRWIHRHQTDLKSRVEVIWHVFNMWEVGGLLEAPPMIAWAHHFLLEGVPTCHGGSWVLLSRWMLRCGPLNPCALPLGQ